MQIHHICSFRLLLSTPFNPTWRGSFLTKFPAGGGRNHLHPSNQPKNQIFRLNHGRTLKYRQLLDSRKKMGSIAPKLGPYRRIKISAKMSKIAISRNSRIFTKFDLVHENGSSSVIFGTIHLISFANGHWQAILGVGWGSFEWSPRFVAKFWSKTKKHQDFEIRKFTTHLTLRAHGSVPPKYFQPFMIGS